MSERKIRRREGLLEPLKTQNTITRMIFYDTETWINEDDNGNLEFPFRLGVAIYVETDKNNTVKKRIVYRFTSPEEFYEIVLRHTIKKKALYIFAHNTGFDIRTLEFSKYISSNGHKSTPPIIRAKAFIWRIYTNHGTIIFLDTANFAVNTVKQLGDDLGFNKLSIDFNTDDIESVFLYCQRDVEIIEKFMLDYLRFLTEHELGSFKVTLASQALASFRTKFMNKQPFIYNNEDALKLAREAYYGGRTEAFYIGDLSGEEYYDLDVNSMYPYAMVNAKIPTRFLGYSENVPLTWLGIRLKKYACIVDVELDTDENCFPLRHDGKLIFPTGRFRTTLNHAETEYAYREGYIKRVNKCAIYEYHNIFREYVDFFYTWKQCYSNDGNKSYRYITKIFLNSLYGKFGQLNIDRQELGKADENIVWRLPCYNKEQHTSFTEICWYGDVWRENRGGETHFSLPCIAGSITSYARILLYKYMLQASLSNVFYCDTDSLIVNKQGFNNLSQYIDNQKLGSLKLEDTSNVFRIYGAKDYKFGEMVKIKGVQKDAQEIEENAWSYVQFQGFTSWLNNGALTGAIGKRTTKRRYGNYTKGKVLPDGRVVPFVFPID